MKNLFSQRIGRQDFIIRYLPCAILASIDPDTTLGVIVFLFGEPFATLLFITMLAVLAFYLVLLIIQRANDIGWSRWSALLAIVPVVSVILGVVLFFRKGTGSPTEKIATTRSDSASAVLLSGQERAPLIEDTIKKIGKRSLSNKSVSWLGKNWFQIAIILFLVVTTTFIYREKQQVEETAHAVEWYRRQGIEKNRNECIQDAKAVIFSHKLAYEGVCTKCGQYGNASVECMQRCVDLNNVALETYKKDELACFVKYPVQ